MERRRFLTVIGTSATAGVVGLAGCGSPGGDTGGTPGGNGAGETPGAGEETDTPGDDGATETPGETTETDTPEGEDTETPGDDGGTEGQETPSPGEEGNGAGGGGDGGGDTPIAMVTDGEEYIFDPIGLYVEPGTEVTWVNESGSHSSTAYTEDNPQSETRLIPEEAEGWDSSIISSEGEEFSHTFETEGTYDYYCTPHKSLGMVGRIVVGSPGGPAEEGQPPDGNVPESDAIVDQGSIAYGDFQG